MKYDLGDVGCYVDSARGIYMIDRIAQIAENHGMTVSCGEMGEHQHAETCDKSKFAGCEFANELEDEIDDWMNEHYPVAGASWGRSENSDWGLWPNESD